MNHKNKKIHASPTSSSLIRQIIYKYRIFFATIIGFFPLLIPTLSFAEGIKETCLKAIAAMVKQCIVAVDLTNVVMECFAGGGGGAKSGAVASATTTALEIATNTSKGLTSIGLAMAVCFFLMALIDLAVSERMTFETFIKFFAKFAAAMFLVEISPDLITAIPAFGTAFCEAVAFDGGEGIAKQAEQIRQDVLSFLEQDEGHWIVTLLSMLLPMLIMNLIGVVLRIVTYVIAFTRVIEMAIRGAFLPVAMGMIADDGWKGAAGRYVRKYIAICSQGAILIFIGTVYGKIVGQTISNNILTGGGFDPMTFFVLPLALAFATVTLMFKSIGFINDVFGA